MDDKADKTRKLKKAFGQVEAALAECQEEREQLEVKNKDLGLRVEELELLEKAYEKKIEDIQAKMQMFEAKTGSYMIFTHVLMAALGLFALPLLFVSVVGWSGLFAFLTGLMIYFVLIVINHTFTADIQRKA
jgi:hypothetical protein